MTAAPVSNPSHRLDRWFVGWLSLAQLISWGSVFYTFALLMEPLERELGLSRAQSSLAFSLALLAEGLLAYPVGRWIDRGLERRVMTGGSLLMAACLALHSTVHSVAGFYAVWIGLGVAMSATLYTPAFSVVTRRYPQDFRRAIITLTFLGGLASTVFIPLSAWLIVNWGWRAALLWLAALHLVVCVPLHALLLRHAPGVAHHTAANPQAHGERAARLGSLLRSPPFLLVGAFVVLMMAINAALPPHMISLLREAGMGAAWVVAIPASIGMLQVAGRALLYFFEHRFDVHLANRLIPCLIPLGLATLLAAPWLAGAAPDVALGSALLFVALYGLGNGMITIVKGTAIAQYVDRDHVASLNGALGLPSALARALAPWMMGVLWQPRTGYTAGLLVLLLAGVVAVLALWLAQRHRVAA